METNPGNPSAPPIVCGIHPPYASAGASVRFAHNQKLSPPVFNNGGLFFSFVQHDKFLPPQAPAGGAPVSPVHRKCLTPLGVFLCNLPCLSLFDFPRPHGGVQIAPFQTGMGAAAHHSGGPAPSCRLCLIACNSRKFTRSRCQDFNRPMALGGTSR
jgi:hypothetical protein